jgi:hypothetical protein
VSPRQAILAKRDLLCQAAEAYGYVVLLCRDGQPWGDLDYLARLLAEAAIDYAGAVRKSPSSRDL